MLAITIDGQDFEIHPERTVLEAVREQGFNIPTLCHHEALTPFAACRLCMVEVSTGEDWKLVASCAHPCTDGLGIRTRSEAVLRSRRMTVELLMASAAHVPEVRKLADQLGVDEPRYTTDKDDCILCGLCVRACAEIVGVGAISLINRGKEKEVSTPFHIASNTCIECGTCILVCPTGAISFADITAGSKMVHALKSEYDSLDCRVCGHHALTPSVTGLPSLRSTNAASSMPAVPENDR